MMAAPSAFSRPIRSYSLPRSAGPRGAVGSSMIRTLCLACTARMISISCWLATDRAPAFVSGAKGAPMRAASSANRAFMRRRATNGPDRKGAPRNTLETADISGTMVSSW